MISGDGPTLVNTPMIQVLLRFFIIGACQVNSGQLNIEVIRQITKT